MPSRLSTQAGSHTEGSIMVRPEDMNQQQLERLRDEMFGVFMAGWQGCLIYGTFMAGQPINMAAIIAGIDEQEVEVSFDAWLQALVDEADVIGRTKKPGSPS